MTYPPQPGQPPYGQGGQPPSGEFGQQYPGQQHPEQYPGQQYPGQQYPQQGGAYPQQQYPGQGQQPYGQNPQYGQGFGGPPAPPDKSKTGLLVGVAAAVVVLVVLGITGFVAPGFFLGDDKADTVASPEATAQAIVDGINAHDKAALTSLKCADAENDIDEVIEGVGEASNATLGKVTKVSETEATVSVTVSIGGRTGSATGTLAGTGGKWCWKLIGRLSTKQVR